MKLEHAVELHRHRRTLYSVEAGYTFHDTACSVLADAYVNAMGQADRDQPISDEWLTQHGFEWQEDQEELAGWELTDNDCNCIIRISRCDAAGSVWTADILGTTWPVDIRVRAQIYDLCLTLQVPLLESAAGIGV